jgi:hypothetical protein
MVGDAGMGFDGKRKWYAHVYDSGNLLKDLGPNDSPEAALDAVADYLNSADTPAVL